MVNFIRQFCYYQYRFFIWAHMKCYLLAICGFICIRLRVFYRNVTVFWYIISGGKRMDGNMRLEDILQFWTGCRYPPLLGFSIKPCIEFQENPAGFLPTANTCANVLRLPRPSPTDGEKESEYYFKKFDLAFCQKYFGKA